MTVSPRHLEGIAKEVHDRFGDGPIDAFALAGSLGYHVRFWGKSTGLLDRSTIWVPAKARNARQHGVCAHELGHALTERAGEDARDEAAARYLAGALMLPRERFAADLAETCWDLDELRRRHPNASAEMIVVRMTQVSEACASVWDQGALTRHYASAEWLVDLDADHALVDRVLELEAPVRGEHENAWPIFDGRDRRVVVVRRAA